MSIESVMQSNHLILCSPLLLLPSIFPSIRVFSNESTLYKRWPKDWSFSFIISLSNEYSGLISFRMNWLNILEVQGTQESSPTPQFKSINSLVLSFLYSPTLTSIHDYWKNHSLPRQTFVGKAMSLLFNIVSRLIMEKAMAPHSSTLAWKIPWMEEPGGLQSVGSLRVGHDRSSSGSSGSATILRGIPHGYGRTTEPVMLLLKQLLASKSEL